MATTTNIGDYMDQVLTGAALYPAEGEFTHEQLLADANKDVGDETVAATLEDPGLVEHMRQARARLQEQQNAESKVSASRAISELTTVMGRLSGLTGDYRAGFQEFQQSAGQMPILGRHLAKARDGSMIPPFFDKVAYPRRVMDAKKAEELTSFEAEVAAEAREYILGVLDPTIKLLNHHGGILTKKVDAYEKLNGRLSALHTLCTRAFDMMNQVIQEKDKLIRMQHELLKASAALYDYDEVMADKKRREILQFINSSKRAVKASPAMPTVPEEPAAPAPEAVAATEEVRCTTSAPEADTTEAPTEGPDAMHLTSAAVDNIAPEDDALEAALMSKLDGAFGE